MKPFFTVGLTTYNRLPLLKQAVNSILQQTFRDYEVIIGNDFPGQQLTLEMLGIKDERFSICNHACNVGEIANMNYLFKRSQGKYFTWMADDDLYESCFLQVCYDSLAANNFPSCVFTSYDFIRGNTSPRFLGSVRNGSGKIRQFSGKKFLRNYFNNRIKIMSTYGVYNATTLKDMGPVYNPSAFPVGVFGEYLVLAKCGTLDRLMYIEEPLVYFRVHAGSWTCSNKDVEAYTMAGVNVIIECTKIFSCDSLKSDYYSNLLGMLKIILNTIGSKMMSDWQGSPLDTLLRFQHAIEANIEQGNKSIESKIFKYNLRRITHTVVGEIMAWRGTEAYRKSDWVTAGNNYFQALKINPPSILGNKHLCYACLKALMLRYCQ
jgi:glycosyltransferase involved in cell wall biosynthesis